MALWKIGVLLSVLTAPACALRPFSGQGQIATIPQQSYASDMQLLAKRSPVDFLPDGDPSVYPGAEWRANFFRAAGEGGDDRRKFLAWSIIPEGKTFHVPTRFGILRFVN